MTLPYELAKALRDAGWPQDDGVLFATDDCAPQDITPDSYAYSPSLSELIEACPISYEIDHPIDGEKDVFFALVRDDGKWRCGHKGDLSGWWLSANGETPEIAVANLWLNLRKEGKV